MVRLTDEQELARDLFATGQPLVINAGAGTGKTATLEVLAGDTARRGRYLAFNRAIVDEARARMPRNVRASTVHSLAYRTYGRRMAHRINAPRQPSWKTAKHLRIDPIKLKVGNAAKLLQPGWLAGHVMRAAVRFCQSADPEPSIVHFPYLEGIDPRDAAGRRTFDNNIDIATQLLPALQRAWDDLRDPDGQVRYLHDAYVKEFALDGQAIDAAYVLHDEAQDATPVVLQILARQPDLQVVHVGDQYQSVYSWRGAVNAMARAAAAGAQTAWLTRSFRFGPKVAELANAVLGMLDAEIQLAGNPNIASTVARIIACDAVLCRTNAKAVNEVLDAQARGLRPYLVGGGDDIVDFAQASQTLQDGQDCRHPELACFTSWPEVQDFVAQDPQGDELRMLVELIDQYGAQTVIDALAGLPDESRADVVVSTAHKAKGRQWPTVRLADDFDRDDDRPISPQESPEEIRLLYMAVTRAQQVIDPYAAEQPLAAAGVDLGDLETGVH